MGIKRDSFFYFVNWERTNINIFPWEWIAHFCPIQTLYKRFYSFPRAKSNPPLLYKNIYFIYKIRPYLLY